MDIKTTDIYLTAYLLSQNIRYKKIQSEGKHRKKVIFIFPNTSTLSQHTMKYRTKEAMVNVADFAHSLERARDIIFSTLRAS